MPGPLFLIFIYSKHVVTSSIATASCLVPDLICSGKMHLSYSMKVNESNNPVFWTWNQQSTYLQLLFLCKSISISRPTIRGCYMLFHSKKKCRSTLESIFLFWQEKTLRFENETKEIVDVSLLVISLIFRAIAFFL